MRRRYFLTAEISDDPNDLESLTPNHLLSVLSGDVLLSGNDGLLPKKNKTEDNGNILNI